MIKFKKRFEDLKFANLPNSEDLAKKYGHDFIIKLNYNENKFGPSPTIKETIEIKSPNIYPEYKSPKMIKKLAEIYGLDQDNFYVSNGSDSILDYIPTLFASKTRGDNVVVPELTYGRIATTAKINGIKVKLVDLIEDTIDLDKTLEAIDDSTAIVYIVNPNMPHGTLNSHENIIKFIEKVPSNVLVVIDEAYAEYAHGVKKSFELDKELIERFDNLIITRTMSKMFGLASFRIGYMISDPKIVNLFRRTAQVVPVNKYSLQAARAALNDIPWYDEVRRKTKEQAEKIYKCFDELNIEYVPTNGNYILIKIPNPDLVREFILDKQGIIIRQVRDFGLRLTIGNDVEVDKTIEGFTRYVREKNGKS